MSVAGRAKTSVITILKVILNCKINLIFFVISKVMSKEPHSNPYYLTKQSLGPCSVSDVNYIGLMRIYFKPTV